MGDLMVLELFKMLGSLVCVSFLSCLAIVCNEGIEGVGILFGTF